MGWIGRLIGRKAAPVQPLDRDDVPHWWLSTPSRSGVHVTTTTALQVSTVLACVRVIAQGMAQVPLKVHQRTAAGKSVEAVDHPLYWLLHRRPNSWMTAYELRALMTVYRELTGDAVCYKSRSADGRLLELLPVPPDSLTIKRNRDLSLTYQISLDDGQILYLGQDDVWHERGLQWRPERGLDMIKVAREAIGLSIATEQSQADLHRNGLRTSGVWTLPEALTDEQHNKLSAWIRQKLGGDRRFDPLIVDRGATYTPHSMTGVDAQHIETRKHQVEEICRLMGVMPIMIGYADKTATYASAEQMFIAHVVHCLAPRCEAREQSIDVQLLGVPVDTTDYYVKHNLNGLMRGSAKDRGEYYTKMYNIGALSPNEIRAYEDMDGYDGGDEHRVPLNMTPAGQSDTAPTDESQP